MAAKLNCERMIMNSIKVSGNNVIIKNGKVIVDGNEVSSQLENLTINIFGNVENLDVDACKIITISGDAKKVNTASGNVTVHNNVSGNVSTVSGDVKANDIGGDVETVSGDVNASKILGDVDTVSGDIHG
jgi:hypothetical protein